MDKARAVSVGALLGMMLGGCAALIGGGDSEAVAAPAQAQAPLGDPTCLAESYDFVGEGTLAGLGLDTATPVLPPEPNRQAKIWVTHDLFPHDTGGSVLMWRMLCFEFADGSGGSGWPVDPAWQPPGSAPSDVQGIAVPSTLLLLGLVVLLAVGVSAIAFRRRG